MAIEETLLIKLIIDIQQSIKSIDNLEKQFAGLSATIKTTFNVAANDVSNLAKEQTKTAQATATLNEQIKKQKAAFDATKFPEGSYRALNAQLKDLNNRFKELSATERNSPIGAALSKNINQIKGQLKNIDAGIGDFQRNVGNYGNSLRGLFKGLSAQLQSTSLFGKIPTLPALFNAASNALKTLLEGIRIVTEAFSSQARISRVLAAAQDDIIAAYTEVRKQADSLFSTAAGLNATEKEQAAAIAQINSEYGKYLPSLLTDKSSQAELAAAYKIVNAQLIENIVQKQRAVIVEKLLKEAIDAGLAAKKAEQAANEVSLFQLLLGNGALIKSGAALSKQNAETAKTALQDTKAIESGIRETVTNISDLNLNFSNTIAEGDAKQASAFEKLSNRKSALEAEIKNLIVTGGDYSKQQTELVSVTEKLNKVETEFAAITKASETATQRLSRQRGELEAQIKNLILTGGDYSKQLKQLEVLTKKQTDADKEFAAVTQFNQLETERLTARKNELTNQIQRLIDTDGDYSAQQIELQKTTAKLTEVEKLYADATRVGETEVQRLTRRQSELNAEIELAIQNGQPYDTQLNELIGTTKGLTDITKQFAVVEKEINIALREFANGSLADYDQRISDLSENQKNLNLTSAEYAANQAQIINLETERDTILRLLATDLTAVAAAQTDLNNQLTDQQAQNAALQAAKARIAGVTDATQAGAAQIAQIEKDLAKELQNIEATSLQRRLNGINTEIAALEAQRQKELALAGNNDNLKLAIEANFQQQKTDLELQGAAVRGQILKTEVDDAKAAQAEILTNATEAAEQRKAVEQQVTDAIAQGAQMVFQIISNLQQQQLEKQLELLDNEEAAALRRAEAFGASEEAKTKIQAEFDAKREKIERDAANRAKGLALAQATIEIALAVLKALASAPPPANAILAGITAALGAIQLAVIASQKFALGSIFDMDVKAHQSFGGGSSGGSTNLLGSGNNHFARGAYLKNGAYHSEGGMPIINPFSGKKVAEIEKGEAIINKKNTSLFYDELSFINSFKGRGVSFPNASGINDFEGLQARLKQKGIGYALGGTFGQFNPDMLRLQNGAVVAADIAREANSKFATTNVQASLLTTVIAKLDQLNRTLISGFESIPSTAQELQAAAQILKDAENAS